MARILVVDDEESIRFSFQMFLSNAGHEVAVAENTINAMDILSGNEFDIAVIDRILKDGQNGLDFIKYVRNVQPLCEPILISAYPSFSSAAETLQYNIFAYLTKPVKQEEICRVVKEAACKNNTNKEKEKQFLHMQKMGAIGTLAGGLAHDFNNILMLMLGYIELAIMDTPENSPAREHLLEVIKAVNRAKGLTKEILTCSRKNEQERMPIQIPPIIKESLKLLRSGIPNNIKIQQDIHTNCGTILADPSRIHQLIINLCTNAYHSMCKKGGTLGVSLRNVSITSEAILVGKKFGSGLEPGHYLMLTVTDTGHGMDKDTMKHIFDPYFTTKAIGDGTGLGLSVVHEIVKNHEGTIIVQSIQGKGSTFNVYFPRIENAVAEKTKNIKEVRGGKEHILLVDDDAQIVSIVQQMLESLGYAVTASTIGLEALETFRTQPDIYDLIITDKFMPEMTGIELSVKLLRIRPDIPIILLTGSNEINDADKAEATGIRGCILKPVSIEEFDRVIRQVMD